MSEARARREPHSSRWRVHKFGGSSVADAACLERVASIVEEDPRGRLAVVLSACRGVTDGLLELIAAAEAHDPSVGSRIGALRQRHVEIAEALLDDEAARSYIKELDAGCHDIVGILQTITLIRSTPQAMRDVIVGFGEIWSTRLFTRYLAKRNKRAAPVRWIDARDVIQVEWGALGPAVRWPESRENMSRLTQNGGDETLIVTGFIARD